VSPKKDDRDKGAHLRPGESKDQKTLFDTFSLQLDPQDLVPVFAEGNFEEHPLFRMSSQERTIRAYSYEWAYNAEDGLLLRKKWTVVPSGQYGAPGPADQDVFVAVMELVARRGGLPESGEIDFSLNELLKVLRKSRGGKSYEALKESLLRIAFTGIESHNSFYSASMKSYIEDTFRIWDVRFADYEPSGGTSTSRHTLKFHDVFVNNYFAHYLKNLDTNLYWSLKSPIAKRLYRLIDQKRGQGRFWGQEFFELARQIPLTGSYKYSSKIKEKLKSPHVELERVGFLQSVSYQGGRVVYEVTEEYSRQRVVRESYRSSPEHIFAVERLISENVRGDVAQSLVEEYGVEHCLYYAEALAVQQNLSNPAGWLIEAIRRGYALVDRRSESSATEVTGQGPEEASGLDSGEAVVDESGHATTRDSLPDTDPLALEVWEQVLEDVSEEINAPSLRVWFEGTVPVALSGEMLTISVPNSFAKDYIESRFKELLEGALSKHLSPISSLEIVVGVKSSTHKTDKQGEAG
jgi:plasmid replication initiation protein